MPIVRLKGVTLSCPEPAELAEFYRRLTGGKVIFSSSDFVYLAADPVGMAFQRTERRPAPSWPDPGHPGQMHLDSTSSNPPISTPSKLRSSHADNDHKVPIASQPSPGTAIRFQ